MLSDAYVALFATAMFGSMLVSVVVNLSRLSTESCVSAGCHEGRTALPWLVAATGIIAVLSLARLFGPVFAPPAVTGWLVPTPLSRSGLLRPRLLLTLAGAWLATSLVAAGGFTLGGFAATPVAVLSVATGFLSVVVVAAAAAFQPSGRGPAGLVLWLLVALAWLALLAVAAGSSPAFTPLRRLPGGWALAGLFLLLAVVSGAVAVRRLVAMRARDLAAGGALVPGLSGALATLDLALVYDVLLAHTWKARGAVRPRRGGPVGAPTLVWSDLTRLRRSPQHLALLAAAVVVPYAVVAAGGGRVVVLAAALVGFLALLPTLAGLRVVSRTPSLLRVLPFSTAATRWALLSVPLCLGVLFGLATTPALERGLDTALSPSLSIGVAVGTSAVAAAVRWVTGRPPDYSKPLLTTPAGGVPTNLYGSAVRGFDVLVLTQLPLLISPTDLGAVISELLALAVLSVLAGRR